MNDTIKVVLIGNISSGKTSFIRTLFRDLNFGEVGIPATTGRINHKRIKNIDFWDTPGFQNPEKVCQWVEQEKENMETLTPKRVLDIIKKHGDALHHDDRLVWNELVDADVILYFVDMTGDPETEGHWEASYKLLPYNVLIIYTHIPKSKQKLIEARKRWNNLNDTWGEKGITIEFDSLNRDYNLEQDILYKFKLPKLERSQHELIDQYRNDREKEENKRLRNSFKTLVSLIDHLSRIECYVPDLPKKTDADQENKRVIFDNIKDDLSNRIEKYLHAFCNSILYIWGFRTSRNGSDSFLLPELINDSKDSNKLAMSDLVQIKTTEFSRIFSKYNVKDSVWWRTFFFSWLPNVTDKRMCGGLSLKYQKRLLESFIPCALDFIKQIRERGIATPSKLYPIDNDSSCSSENNVSFIMPTELLFVDIKNSFNEFNEFNWTNAKAAEKEWIPRFFDLFGMPQDS